MSDAISRVAVLTTSFPSAPGDPAGFFVAAEAAELATTADVVVVHPGGTPSDPLRARDGYRLAAAGGGDAFGWPGALERLRERPSRAVAATAFVAGARRRLRDLAPTRVIAHWLIPCAWPIAGVAGVPTEVVCHGSDVGLLARLPQPLRRALLGDLERRGMRFRFVSEALCEQLLLGLPDGLADAIRARASVSPPAVPVSIVDPAARDACRAHLEGLLPGPLVAFVGRVIAGKRPLLALAAAAEARASLVVIGDGPALAQLTAAAEERGVPMHAPGRLPRPEALSWLAACDALVVSSRAEGAPTVVREARALGVPVVACDVGDLATLARVDPGIVLAAPHDLGRALAALLETRTE